MDPQPLVLIFFLAGICLIFVELFVPSGGAIALMCVGSFVASGYYAYQAWYDNYPFYWWSYLASIAVVIPASIIGAFHLLPHTWLGNRMLMAAPTPEEVTPYQSEQAHLQSLIGQQGRALNLMTPGGMVLVNGERLHATGDGLMIEADSLIEVVEVRGTRVVVRKVDEPKDAAPAEFDDESLKSSEEKPPPIDPWSS